MNLKRLKKQFVGADYAEIEARVFAGLAANRKAWRDADRGKITYEEAARRASEETNRMAEEIEARAKAAGLKDALRACGIREDGLRHDGHGTGSDHGDELGCSDKVEVPSGTEGPAKT